jgi:hypothetical protein
VTPDRSADLPGATAEDLAEQGASAAAPELDVPLEAVDADVVEQSVDAGPAERVPPRDLPLEADPADAAEQSVEVELDEDERRQGS